LAREGASIVAFDICAPLDSTLTPGSTAEDLAETARLVEQEGQDCIATRADARDLAALQGLATETVDRFGGLDLLVVNHGMWTVSANSWELEEEEWQESIDVLLTGAWKVCKAFLPPLLGTGRGGSVVLTSSANGFTAQPSAVAYSSAKAGVLNMMRVLAWELGEHGIRVNAVCPGGVSTPMVLEGGTFERAVELQPRYHTTTRNLLDVELLPAQSISDAVLWLLSGEARHVTGVALPVDAGWSTF
jgi:NAD(P)-dependent dehydrogenase (short-subunit alcohol dehydrogenase family)